jgi:predicted nucleotidyltransferase
VDLTRPLAVVTPTLDAAVLQALAATTAWASGARVHRMAGSGSPDGVRKVLARLVEQGIVLAESHPHATLYLLNRDHVAAGPLVALTRVRGEIIDRITAAVTTWSPPLLHASLFGSFARAEAGSASDIDVLLVLTAEAGADHDRRTAQLAQLGADILSWTGNRAQIVDVTPEVLAAMVAAGDPLVESWRVDAVHLTGIRLLDLLRQTRAS